MKNKRFSPLAQGNAAQAAIFFIAFGSLFMPAWAAMTEPFISYTVQKGDSLQALTRSLLLQSSQWGQVAQLNGLKNPNLLQPGQVIAIPKSLLNFGSQPRIATPGKVLSAEGDVQLNGQAVKVGDAVPEGAKLQTGPNSSAVMQLGDGSRVQLMPKTLAEVSVQHSYALRDPASSASTNWFSGTIRLLQGVLETVADKKANRATPLQVTTPTSIVGVRGTHFRVAYEDPASQSARTEVLEGNVRTDITAQKVGSNLGGGFGAAVKPQDRAVNVVALLAAPAAQSTTQVVRDGSAKALYTVGAVAGAALYRAQLAADDKFTQIRGDFKSAGPEFDVASLPNGTYFARVRGVDPANIEGFDSLALLTLVAAPVKLVWPGEIATGAFVTSVPSGLLLKVYNQSVDWPQSLAVQVARDAAFTQDLQTVALEANGTVLLSGITAGSLRYVRFATTASQAAYTSGIYTLELPGNWGTTVLSVAQALKPVK